MQPAPVRVYATIAVGILGLCITSILFFTLANEPSQAQFSGFYLLVFNEIFFTAVVVFIERQEGHLAGPFGKAGFYSSAVIYFCATALVAIVFMTGAFVTTKWLYAIHGVCLCLLAVLFTVLFAASKNISRENGCLQATMENFKQLETRLGIIQIQNSEAAWAGKVAQCQEEIRFFDCRCAVPADTLLPASIAKLELTLAQKVLPSKAMESAIHNVLEEILALVQQRNLEAQNTLRGQF